MFFILIYLILSHYFPLVNKFSERTKNNFCVFTGIKLRALYTVLLQPAAQEPPLGGSL